jgi:hypothetical protein
MTSALAMDQRLGGTRACVFDTYGTLFDVASALRLLAVSVLHA